MALGDLEQQSEVRTDSPTIEVESLDIILAWCACFMLRVRGIDITNAYFHGTAMDRIMLLKVPKGGIPGSDLQEGDMMMARGYQFMVQEMLGDVFGQS